MRRKRMTESLDKYNIQVTISAEDERYPILTVEGTSRMAGYSIDKETGELRRICLCSAYSSRECMCGAWDEIEAILEENYGIF